MPNEVTLILIALAIGAVLFVISLIIEFHHYRDRSRVMADAFLLEPLRVGAQRWHAGAEGSTPQMGEASLSCIRYRVTAKSTRRIAITVQILMRDISG